MNYRKENDEIQITSKSLANEKLSLAAKFSIIDQITKSKIRKTWPNNLVIQANMLPSFCSLVNEPSCPKEVQLNIIWIISTMCSCTQDEEYENLQRSNIDEVIFRFLDKQYCIGILERVKLYS